MKAPEEYWKQRIIVRTERLERFAKILAPGPVMEFELWLIFRAIHKDSYWSMTKSISRKLWLHVYLGVKMWWRLKVLHMDPDDPATWR